MNYSKIIDLKDFETPQLQPFLKDLAEIEMRRFGITKPIIIPDSKHWECAMAMRSFEEFGLLKEGRVFAGIGAGTEGTTFFLASKGCITFPCDRYMEDTCWSDVAPIGMMLNPQWYSELKFPVGNVIPVNTDARKLRLPSSFFDGIYSSGSIEHFGSLEAVSAAAKEIARVLKPGGIASISTEFRLDGPEDRQWFDDNCILFTPDLIDQYILKTSGLELIGELNTLPSDETFYTRKRLVDFLDSVQSVNTLADKQAAYPNLVLDHEGFLFCSVHLLLKKPHDLDEGSDANIFDHFDEEILRNNEAANSALSILRCRQDGMENSVSSPQEVVLSNEEMLIKILKSKKHLIPKPLIPIFSKGFEFLYQSGVFRKR